MAEASLSTFPQKVESGEGGKQNIRRGGKHGHATARRHRRRDEKTQFIIQHPVNPRMSSHFGVNTCIPQDFIPASYQYLGLSTGRDEDTHLEVPSTNVVMNLSVQTFFFLHENNLYSSTTVSVYEYE